MKTDYQFKQDQLVSFNNGVVSGTGRIKGCATTPTAVIGACYIIEVLESTPAIDKDIYPFDHMGMFEVHIQALPKVYKMVEK